MGIDCHSHNGVNETYSKTSCNSHSEGISEVENGMIEPGILTETLIRLEIDLAYLYEKLVNLDVYMTTLSLGESGLGELSKHSDDISEVEVEKAIIVDLLFGYLDSEVTELVYFLNVQRTKIVDALQQIYSCRQRRDGFYTLQEKLHGIESCWKHLQQKLSETKHQLENLHGIVTNYGLSTTYSIEDENLERSGIDLQTARMLEKYISSELDLEKQLLGSKEREEDLKIKLAFKNGVVSDMEAFTEVALKRLLMAEHSCDIYMEISKEMISQIQILQYKLHCSVQREELLKFKLQNSLNEMKDKESALMEIETNYVTAYQRCQNRETLEEEVKLLEEKLKSSESMLNDAKASCEASQEQLFVMENAVESLKELVFVAENRAHNAETKVTTLTEENMELREEVEILKGGGDSNEERISLLEKQVRDLEAQLQNARTASEASFDQQNMLYTAIWDMETLIEELKSKVSKNDSRAENAEEQCLVLAEANLELSKEMRILKSKNENLERSLKESNREKAARVKDVNSGTKLITDMVMQLALERERIQKQLSCLARENKILLEELKKVRNNAKAKQENKGDNGKEFSSNEDNMLNRSRRASTVEEMRETTESVSSINQVVEPSEQNLIDEAEVAGSSTSDDAIADIDFLNKEFQGKEKSDRLYKKSWIFAAIFVLVVSILAMNINWQHI